VKPRSIIPPSVSAAESTSLALGRGLFVLQLIAAATDPLTVEEIARQSGIPIASVARITSTFISLGLLQLSDESGCLSLTAAVLALSSGFLRNFDLCSQIKDRFEALAERTGGTVHLAMRDRLELTLIQSVRPRRGIVLTRADVGTRLHIGECTIGRALMGGLAAAARQRLLQELQAERGPDWPRLEQRASQAFAELDRNGFVVGQGEWNPLVGSVATPLTGPTGEHFAISCIGPISEFSKARNTDRYGPLLLDCAREIATDIGGQSYCRV
jgi:DNA-binding IclR family transcriptional regulator